MTYLNIILKSLFLSVFFVGHAAAEQFNLPLQVDYRLIKRALINELYTGSGQTAELWHDGRGCGYINLSNPRISGKDGLIKLQNHVQARIGGSMGGRCLTLFDWNGELESWQRPTLEPSHTVLTFPVKQLVAYDGQGRRLSISQLQELITRYVEPRLGSLKVDLKQSRPDIQRQLAYYLPKEQEKEFETMVNTLRFTEADAKEEGISLKFAFDADQKPLSTISSAPFSEAEQKQWQAAWQPWDDLLSKAVRQASEEAGSQELSDKLMELLLESRSAFNKALTAKPATDEDPIRTFFIHTWQRLAPELKTLANLVPEIQGLRYLSFIAATDVIYELEALGRPLGLELTSEGFRRLGRLLISGQLERSNAENQGKQ